MSVTETPAVDLTAAGDVDAEGLQPMERAFVEAALDLIQGGEKQWRKEAARRANYKEPRGAAYELIRRPRVIAAISRGLSDAAEGVKVDRTFVLFRAMTNLATCEALGDFRTAHRYLDIIARHADVGALIGANARSDPNAAGASMSMPVNLENLTTDEKRTLLALLTRASGPPSGA